MCKYPPAKIYKKPFCVCVSASAIRKRDKKWWKKNIFICLSWKTSAEQMKKKYMLKNSETGTKKGEYKHRVGEMGRDENQLIM